MNKKIYKLTNEAIMYTSRYFNSLEDYINLELGCPTYILNMDKFHFNPISLNYNTIHFFKNIETLHLYNKEDEYLQINNIQKYIDYINRKRNKLSF